MPPASDWRSASTAEKLMSLDRPQFAAEFLRRNHDYSEDYRVTQDQIASGVVEHAAGMDRLARRWGLSFRACPGHRFLELAFHMATRTFAIRCYYCSRA